MPLTKEYSLQARDTLPSIDAQHGPVAEGYLPIPTGSDEDRKMRISTENQETPEHITEHAVSEHALIARINRRLIKEGRFLRKTRGNSHFRREWGTYYLVDSYKRFVEGIDDLAAYARIKGWLEPGEYLAQEEAVGGKSESPTSNAF